MDAFNKGELCYLQDAEERLSGLMGVQVRGSPVYTAEGWVLESPQMEGVGDGSVGGWMGVWAGGGGGGGCALQWA